MKQKKRIAPKRAKPVVHGGIRYEALMWGLERDLGQNGGYVIAFDEKNGEEIWLQKIYHVAYDNGMESDKQDVFITDLILDSGGDALLITDERGRRYSMSLSDRHVTER
ncbi:MAG: hypothetical protein RPU63_05430 [Candidatus Sedimenticola sp. (ex Thyasira tokunagai)]